MLIVVCFIYYVTRLCMYVCQMFIYVYEFTEPIVTMRIRMYVARIYVMSLWILMLRLNLIVLLYILFDER